MFSIPWWESLFEEGLGASPVVISILPIQKVQFFILTIHILISTLTNYLFY